MDLAILSKIFLFPKWSLFDLLLFPKLQSGWWSFPVTDKANEVVLLAIFSGESFKVVGTSKQVQIYLYFRTCIIFHGFLVRAPINGFKRIILSLLFLFAIVLSCICYTDESSTIVEQGLSLSRILGLHCSVISLLSGISSS